MGPFLGFGLWSFSRRYEGKLPLDRLDHFDHRALGGAVAVGSKRDLATPNGLKRRDQHNIVLSL